MNERLPYEEKINQQLADLPLPDNDMAWADMKRRLEEDDDSGIIPFWLRGCGLWGMLAVVLVGISWWWFYVHKQPVRKEGTKEVQQVKQRPTDDGQKKGDTISSLNTEYHKKSGGSKFTRQNKPASTNDENSGAKPDTDEKTGDYPFSVNKQAGKRNETATISITGNGIDRNNPQNNGYPKTNRQRNKTTNNQAVNKDNIIVRVTEDRTNTAATANQDTVKNNQGIAQTGPPRGLPAKDNNLYTTTTVKTPVAVKDTTIKETLREPKKDSAKQKAISFGAGIAFHQLLPIAGQRFTPYNSLGRKGSLADYIPSAYFRMYRINKWFLQSEFRYGAPQYTRDIIYGQKIIQDTQGTVRTTTSSRLKKTFYHQLPVTFNYFIMPNLSVGSGFVWNRFSAAVSEQDAVRRTIATGMDSVISQGVIQINRKADTNFARSYFQAIIETQYQWKRLSIGARYAFGLQPYLRFTLPGGTQQQEKNSSLQVFLRYELWRSKKKP